MAQVTYRKEDEHGLVVFLVHGKVTLRDLTDALEGALDLGLAEFALWNFNDGDLRGLALGQLEAFERHIFSGPWAPRCCAILASSGASLAAVTTLSGIAEAQGRDDRLCGFIDNETALEWLGVQEPLTLPGVADDDVFVRR